MKNTCVDCRQACPQTTDKVVRVESSQSSIHRGGQELVPEGTNSMNEFLLVGTTPGTTVHFESRNGMLECGPILVGFSRSTFLGPF